MAGIRIELRKTTERRWPSRRPQQWYFRVIAADGTPLATSRTYDTRTEAIKAARQFRAPIQENPTEGDPHV